MTTWSLIVALFIGNFLVQGVGGHDWFKALEISTLQAVAVGIHWFVLNKIKK